jgi:hypothetical protein
LVNKRTSVLQEFHRLPQFLLSPVLRAMPDVEDFGNVVLETVYDNVRRAVQFAGSFDFLAGAAKAWEMLQDFDAVKNRPGDFTRGLGVVP